MPNDQLLVQTDKGTYCPTGDFYVDPIVPVPYAVITHAHGDHAVSGSTRYLCGERSRLLLKHRLGHHSQIDALKLGKGLNHQGVNISFYPAGHILGSCQVRIEHKGEVWVVTGDFKRQKDSTCLPFEPVKCHALVMESTFGLPEYRWKSSEETAQELLNLIGDLRAAGKTVIVMAYALGKAQRTLSMIAEAYPDIYVDEKIFVLNRFYRKYRMLSHVGKKWRKQSEVFKGSVLMTTPFNSRIKDWMNNDNLALVKLSGWQAKASQVHQVALSDHADFPALLATVEEVNPERVFVTHGQVEAFADTLRSKGVRAEVF